MVEFYQASKMLVPADMIGPQSKLLFQVNEEIFQWFQVIRISKKYPMAWIKTQIFMCLSVMTLVTKAICKPHYQPNKKQQNFSCQYGPLIKSAFFYFISISKICVTMAFYTVKYSHGRNDVHIPMFAKYIFYRPKNENAIEWNNSRLTSFTATASTTASSPFPRPSGRSARSCRTCWRRSRSRNQDSSLLSQR